MSKRFKSTGDFFKVLDVNGDGDLPRRASGGFRG